jgi:hypothetical protein
MGKWDEAEQAYREVMSIMPSLAPAVNSVPEIPEKSYR